MASLNSASFMKCYRMHQASSISAVCPAFASSGADFGRPCCCSSVLYFIFSIPGVSSTVPITIEMPERVSQTKFNLERWAEILTDPALAKLPNRIETDRHGHILMSPPPAFRHSRRPGSRYPSSE